MEMNNSNLISFRQDFKKAVSSLQEQYGITISLGRISYNDEMFSAKLTVVNGQDPEEVARHKFDTDVWK